MATEIINPLNQLCCSVQRVNEGACSAYYVETSDISSQLPVLTGPFMDTEEGAIAAWNNEWKGKLK